MLSSFLNRIILVVVLLALLSVIVAAQTTDNNTPLTNAAVVKLVRAGFKEKTVVSIIGARAPNFDLSPERMIDLKKSGVSEKIILAMLARQQGAAVGDDWGDEPLFDQTTTTKSKDNQKSDTGNSADIFGSSGSGQSNTKSRGGNSSASGDIQTTGSATVRIIRPPTEGGAPPKLEKTPPLTNDSIVDLVEAGFSEGTIIRRIEQSPVEFDFSSAKLAELRQHRVSEKILTAMKAAMGDDPKATGTGAVSNGPPKPE